MKLIEQFTLQLTYPWDYSEADSSKSLFSGGIPEGTGRESEITVQHIFWVVKNTSWIIFLCPSKKLAVALESPMHLSMTADL